MRLFTLLILFAIGISALSGCTNDEGSGDLDVLTPNDTTSAVLAERASRLN